MTFVQVQIFHSSHHAWLGTYLGLVTDAEHKQLFQNSMPCYDPDNQKLLGGGGLARRGKLLQWRNYLRKGMKRIPRPHIYNQMVTYPLHIPRRTFQRKEQEQTWCLTAHFPAEVCVLSCALGGCRALLSVSTGLPTLPPGGSPQAAWRLPVTLVSSLPLSCLRAPWHKSSYFKVNARQEEYKKDSSFFLNTVET